LGIASPRFLRHERSGDAIGQSLAAHGLREIVPFAAWLAALYLLAVSPILRAAVPPLGPYVGHLAGVAVLAAHGSDPLLARFFGIDTSVLPNRAMDLFVPPLVGWVGIYWAGKIFVLRAFLLVLTGAHAVQWALTRRLSLGPSAAALFLYSEITTAGLLDYLFGIGLALWAFALWIRLGSRRAALRGAVSAFFIVGLFLCNLSALCLYAAAVAGYELWRLHGAPHRATGLAALALPFLVVPALFAAGPSAHAPADLEWRLAAKAQGLWFIAKTYYSAYDAVIAAMIVAGAVWAWKKGMLRLHPAGQAVLAIALPLYLALPYAALGARDVDTCFPLGLVLLLCGFLDWRIATPTRRRGFVLALAALLSLRVAGVAAADDRLQPIVDGFDRSLALIPLGSSVMVAQDGDIPLRDTLLALPSLAMIERASLVSSALAPDERMLVVKPPYRALAMSFGDAPPRLDELRKRFDWRQAYQYLYVVGAGAVIAAPYLVPLYRVRDFQLYRVLHRP
jgi:hypothetical protein